MVYVKNVVLIVLRVSDLKITNVKFVQLDL